MNRFIPLAALAAVCGCANYYIPTQLTVLKLSPGWQQVDFQGADPQIIENALIAGAHMWDAVGATFRENTDVADQTPEAIANAQQLEVVVDDNLGGYSGPEEGFYSPLEGRIHVSGLMIGSNFIQMSATDFPAMLTCVFAHEIGHSMGLVHVTDPAAIMYPVSSGGKSLETSDVTDYNENAR